MKRGLVLIVVVGIAAASVASSAGGTGEADESAQQLVPGTHFSPVRALIRGESAAPGAVARPRAASVVVPTVLHFNGNAPEDAGCTGRGDVDALIGDTCSDLRPTITLSSSPAADWVAKAGLNGAVDRNPYDPNWIWLVSEPTTLSGNMTINWWQACNAECVVLGGTWRIRLWADGVQVFLQEDNDATPTAPHVPSLLNLSVTLPTVTANSNFVLHIDTQFSDTGQGATAFYDSSQPCPGVTTGTCDSTVTMPVDSTPTAVRMLGFSARAERGRVVVRWRTAAEDRVAGFNVWRGKVSARKLNPSLIPARGGLAGASYRFVDRTVRPGKSYSYRLQIVERDGSHSWYSAAHTRVASDQEGAVK